MTDVTEIAGIAAGFGLAGRADWLSLAGTLKGGDFVGRLVGRTIDGLPIEPIYERAKGEPLAISRQAMPWQVTSRLDHPDLPTANALAMSELEGGAESLALVVRGSRAARGFGTAIETVDDLEVCLAGVMLDMIHLRIEPHARADLTGHLIVSLTQRLGLDRRRLQVSFGLDPLRALRNDSTGGWRTVGADLTRFVVEMKHQGFCGPFITCDVRLVSEAGGSEAQEIAFALASSITYVRALVSNGIPIAEAFRALSWTIAIDADQFLGIAKLRAMRAAWARLQVASRVAVQPLAIHAETAWRMMTQRDPAVNMLRSTMATFVAAVGGADSIAVLPHTLTSGLPDGLSRRIARNTQLVLQEESQLWRVADPAAGSGAFEQLTAELCEAAWGEFQKIEREGGLVESLRAGALQSRVEAVAAARREAVATRKAPITGTSEFPSLSKASGGVVEGVAASCPEARSRLLDLPSQRLAEPFEALRNAADAAAKSGIRPSVFLANLGSLADYGTRSMWISNLLAAGGITAVSDGGFTASGPAGAAFASSGSPVAVVCGSDETFAELAEATVACLKSAGAVHVAVAGKPGSFEEALRAAGADQFIFVGQDVIAQLRDLHRALGIGS